MKFAAKKNPTLLAGDHVSRQISFEKTIVGISQYAYFSSTLYRPQAFHRQVEVIQHTLRVAENEKTKH
jgi:hypothetical protein